MGKNRVRLLAYTFAAFSLFAAPSITKAQCDHPKTDAQRAQCVGDGLRGSDRTINRVYGDLMKSLSAEDRLKLRDDQRAWIKTRDKECNLLWSKGDREAWLADLLKDYQKTVCVVRLTNARVQTLDNYQQANAVAAPTSKAANTDAEPIYELFAREPKTKGKWYFEVKVDEPSIQKQAEATFSTGIAQAAAEAGSANPNGFSYGSLITVRRVDKIVEVYTLGFAIDLDNGKFYTSKNGEWEQGTPGSSGGMDLLRGRSYRGQFTSSVALNSLLKSHVLDINFGDRAFTYHIPDGYSPLQAH